MVYVDTLTEILGKTRSKKETSPSYATPITTRDGCTFCSPHMSCPHSECGQNMTLAGIFTDCRKAIPLEEQTLPSHSVVKHKRSLHLNTTTIQAYHVHHQAHPSLLSSLSTTPTKSSHLHSKQIF
jgi:hypothetical protein